MAKFQCVNELVKALQPIDPVYCFRKQSLKLASNWFNHNFPGDVLYAVKCNPTETVVKTLIKNGIKNKYINENAIVESLISFKRAGASAIVTYFAIDIAKKL